MNFRELVLSVSRIITISLALFLGSFLTTAYAATSDINVTAELSRSRVAAGDMVQLDVKVTGSQEADLPREITVDGLQIRLTGQSSQMQMINFSVSSSVVYSYIVIPLQSGTFTIPSIQVRAEGRYFKTTPLQLTVVGSGGTTPGVSSRTAPPSPSSIANFSSPSATRSQRSSARGASPSITFGELVLPKKKLYAGEVVPVEIRFYFDIHYGVQIRGGLNFGGEGFLAERFGDPEQSQVERDGVPYHVLTFRTLISAVKPGSLDIAPASINLLVEMPETAPAGVDDDLFSLVLRRHRAAFMQQKEMTAKSNPLHIEVMPLPKEGRPADFSGAIGEFDLDAMVLPQKYMVGDPVTLSLKINGKGNFKALSAPQLTDTDGWRTYPPFDHFEATDGIGWRGVKTFETTMIAQKPMTTTPGSLFSYFDPNLSKYVTLTTKPLSVEVLAQTSSSASTKAATVTTNAPAASPTPASHAVNAQAQNQPFDHFSTHSWKAPFQRLEFIVVSIALFFAALLFALYLGLRQYQKTGGSPQHQEELKLKTLLAELQSEELDAIAFYNKAAEVAEILVKKGTLSESEGEEIFKRRDELHYGAREAFLYDKERKKILSKLKLN